MANWTRQDGSHRAHTDYHILSVWRDPDRRKFIWLVAEISKGDGYRATGIELTINEAKKMAEFVARRRER